MHCHARVIRVVNLVFILCVALAVNSGTSLAQLPAIKLYSISPAGGQLGTTFELNVTGGDDLDELNRLVFNNAGITAKRKTVDKNGVQVPDGNKFLVTIGEAVAPGVYQVRAGGLYGVSNPRVFVVGTLPESTEQESNNSTETANVLGLNSTVNGVISGRNEIDFFQVSLKAGQRVLLELAARSIDSKLDGQLRVYDPNGRRIESSLRSHFEDPFLDITAKTAGEYIIAVNDQEFEGAGDFHYRLKAHRGPHFDFVDPPAAIPGQSQQFTIYGRNLPGGQPTDLKIHGKTLQKVDVKIDVPSQPQTDVITSSFEATTDGVIHRHQFPDGQSLSVPIRLASAPLVSEVEPNNTQEQIQTVSVPSEIIGRFKQPNDADRFKFSASKGDDLWITVFAHRDGTPVDVYLAMVQVTKDKNGKVTRKTVAIPDDDKNNLLTGVFVTQTDDPSYNLKVPVDCEYHLYVVDRFGTLRANPAHHYRLCIRSANPDFRMVAMPQLPIAGKHTISSQTSVNLRRGDNIGIQVMLDRREGFSGDVELEVSGLPEGVTTNKTVIGNAQNSAMLVLTASEDAKPGFTNISVSGKSVVGGKSISRPARVGAVMFPGANNAPALSRTSSELGLSIQEESTPVQTLTESSFFDVRQSSQILIPVKLVKRDGFDADVNYTIADLPKNSNFDAKNFKIAKGQADFDLRIFVSDKTKEGTYNFYFKPQTQVDYRRNVGRVERLKTEQAKLAEALKAVEAKAKEVAKKASEIGNQIKKLDGELKSLDTTKKQLEQKLTASKTALQKAQQQFDAEKKAADAKTQAVDAAKKSVDTAKQASENAKDDENLAKALKAAEDKLKAAERESQKQSEVVKQKQTELTAAQQALTKTTADVKKTADDIAKQNEMRKSLTAEKTKIDGQSKSVAGDVAAKKTEKSAIDKQVADAEKSAKPQKLTIASPSIPVTIRVGKAAVQLSPNVPKGGTLKRGEKLEIKVGVKRLNEFKGPVELSLATPPNVQGLNAARVTIPPDAAEGVLVVEAAGDATEGTLQNLVVRGTADFNGRGYSDAPIAIKINK